MYDQIPVINNEAERSFEMTVDGKLAVVDYKKRGDKYLLVHTEVPREWQGHGVAAVLVEKTLHYLEDHHLKMVPYCAYIKAYLNKHPDWKRLLPE